MTTKEKVINESMVKVKSRLAEINAILDSNPVQDIIELHKGAQELLEANMDNYTDPAFMKKINALAKKEKELFAISKKRQSGVELIEEKVKLESELSDLKSELWYMDKSNFR